MIISDYSGNVTCVTQIFINLDRGLDDKGGLFYQRLFSSLSYGSPWKHEDSGGSGVLNN